LEDLLEQEKREQARNIGSAQVVDVNNPQNVQQGLLNDQVNSQIFQLIIQYNFIHLFSIIGL
jgi:hypothetical protein